MTFEDLPPDWPSRPVTDPAITADVLDLVVRNQDRAEGALCLILCGGDRRIVQPVAISGAASSSDPEDRRAVFAILAGLAEREGFDGGVLVAIARDKGPFITDNDRAWHEAAITSCRETGIALLGVWVVTSHVIRQVPDLPDLADLDLASA